MKMQDILDRLKRIDDLLEDSEPEQAQDALDALRLDIEIHCRRNGVPFV